MRKSVDVLSGIIRGTFGSNLQNKNRRTIRIFEIFLQDDGDRGFTMMP
jgi:hypothetical protein